MAQTKPTATRKRSSGPNKNKPTAKRPRNISSAQPVTLISNEAPATRLDVYVFGEGSAGELGLGTNDAINVKRPRLNSKLDAEKVGVVDIAAGGMHVVALTYDNKVLTWGVNDNCALGRETSWEGGVKDPDNTEDDAASDSTNGDLNPYESTPTAIPTKSFAPRTKIVAVAAGDSASFALTQQGSVYGWGTFVVSTNSP